MMLKLLFVSLVVDASAAVVLSTPKTAFLASANASIGKYGKDKCKCVGMDNQKGWFSLPLGKHHVQYPIEIGASCEAWESFKGVQFSTCSGKDAPAWCSQKWCYVDPCSCDLEILPKRTETGIMFQGAPAYWSYDTCGGKDSYSATMVEGACVNQKDEKACAKSDKCAWNGKQCLGKELVETCKAETKLDEAVVGQEDCRCVGHSGKNGIAKMPINDTHEVDYSANVGGECGAWENDAHPACKVDGKKPGWCSKKWCWVDPCKCKTSVPPKATMQANSHLKFQGIVAHWSYATCGNDDEYSADSSNKYCHMQKDASSCADLKNCAWTANKECMSKEVVEMCKVDVKDVKSASGLPWSKSGAYQFGSLGALVLAVASFA